MQDPAVAMVRVRHVPSRQRSVVGHSLLVVQAAPVDLRSWHCRVAVSQKASPAHRVLAVHGWPSTGITAHVNMLSQ